MLGVAYDKIAVKETRRHLAENVRNDWEDVLARAVEAESGDTSQSNDDLTRPPVTAAEWRERSYAQSDRSSSEESDVERAKPIKANAANAPTSPRRRRFSNHHCMFPDGSDADGDSGTDSPRDLDVESWRRKQARTWRRRRRLEEEMTWNKGLRNWEQTRDIWCRARRVSVSFSSETPISSAATSLASATGIKEPTLIHGDILETTMEPVPPISTPSPPPLVHVLHTVQLPVPPPIIPPTDPGRTNIVSQYKAIYDKVVIESLRPQVPINLSHMVPALVKGWKDNDEWPPKSNLPTTALNPATGRASALLSHSGIGSQPRKRNEECYNGLSSTMEVVAEKGRRLLRGSISSKSKSKGATPPRTPDKANDLTNTWHASLGAGDDGGEKDDSARDSARDSPGGRERSSPLQVRRNVARMSRVLRGSLSGPSGTSEEKL